MAEPSVDPGFWSSIANWLWGIVLAMFGVGVKHVNGKADKSEVAEILKRIDKSNEHIEKLYSNAEADRRFTRDLHDKAMDTIITNQREIMRAVTK